MNNRYHDDVDSTEYKLMEASVNKYGGFYIARYEAGKPSATPAIDGTVPPLSQANKVVWNDIKWENDYNIDYDNYYNPDNAGNSNNPGAALVAKKMYDNNASVVSQLAYGSQWDTIIQWLIDTEPFLAEQIVTGQDPVNEDSRNWGNYYDDNYGGNDGIKNTGSRNEFKVNNIYDLAGNVMEWTMEIRDNDSRAMRGGNRSNLGTFTAAIRDYTLLYDDGIGMYSTYGFRVALYIK